MSKKGQASFPFMGESAAAVAQNKNAPASERFDAQTQMAKSALSGGLLPLEDVSQAIAFIQERIEADRFEKALSNNAVVPFPPEHRKPVGKQSVNVDEYGLVKQGEYWDRPGILSFQSMRTMVDATPILQSIIITRIHQVQRFCRPLIIKGQSGFSISHVDPDVEMSDVQKAATQKIGQFMLNCGWETDPRQRKRLKRDTLSQFMAKSIRDSLTLDSAPIETEFKNARNLGIDGFYAVDGATIRLCTEDGYSGDDEIFALQVIDGRICTAYGYDDLIYEVRNPRTDVQACGYGMSEVEMLIRVVTYLLNTMTYNGSFFDKNSIPRGILNLAGNYDQSDLAAFRRYWYAIIRGIENAHNLPVLVSKDQESKAQFTEIGGQMSEMAFGKWMSFLISVACAVFCISPEEISMESYSAGKSSLSGSDTEEKLTSSSDKGLRSLLAHYENLFSDFIVQTFSPEYMFRFEGLDADDAARQFEARKIGDTWNEFRTSTGRKPIDGPLGDAPVNPTLLSAWQAERQAQQQAEQQNDFGQPPDGNGAANEAAAKMGRARGKGGDPQDEPQDGEPGQPQQSQEPPSQEAGELSKSFGLPDNLGDL